MKLTIELPIAFNVEDYHDIDIEADFIRKLSGDDKIKCEEIAFGPFAGEQRMWYWGILYKGKMPSLKQCDIQLRKAGYDMNFEE